MRAGCSPERQEPSPFPSQEGGLFLSSGEQDAKGVICAQTQGPCGEIAEQLVDPLIRQGLAFDHASRTKRAAFREELQRANAVSAMAASR